jgi:protein-L-isoaspartate(D-aspartate) O-methyltransferase
MNDHNLKHFYEKLDRAYFIDNEYKVLAGLDQPLPIGYEQTISQPSLVLQMTQLLELQKGSKVLEIGTGSGYQTALLAEFSESVYTIERIKELSQSAKDKLDRLGYTNIDYKIGDGSLGWAEHSPYDRIICTAAAQSIPAELAEQLADNGRMILPVGPAGLQELMLIKKDGQGKVSAEPLSMVRFVEMKGKYGWHKEK